jgi:hypothetical protein
MEKPLVGLLKVELDTVKCPPSHSSTATVVAGVVPESKDTAAPALTDADWSKREDKPLYSRANKIAPFAADAEKLAVKVGDAVGETTAPIQISISMNRPVAPLVCCFRRLHETPTCAIDDTVTDEFELCLRAANARRTLPIMGVIFKVTLMEEMLLVSFVLFS